MGRWAKWAGMLVGFADGWAGWADIPVDGGRWAKWAGMLVGFVDEWAGWKDVLVDGWTGGRA